MVPANRPIPGRLAALLLAVALAGCPRNRGIEEDLRVALVAADIAWRDRDTGGLPAVGKALDAAEAVAPDHPEVDWRRVRLGIAEGLAAEDPVDTLRAYSTARSVGLTCVAGPDGASRKIDVTSLRVDDARAPCVAWTALAWARWLEAFGPAAGSLDIGRIDRLIVATTAAGPLPPPHTQVGNWADGILSAVRTDAPDLERADERFRWVAEEHGDDVVVMLDWLRLVAEPRGDTAVVAQLTETLREAELDTPEERGAVGAWRTRTVGAP